MGKMKKKYTCGQATAYVSRNKALRRLQLSLANFRRLCILKGIYPVEPKDRKKANKGVHSTKTFYYAKDIRLLAQEPVLDKFRELKIFARKLSKAKGKKEFEKLERIRRSKPLIELDHILLERYPQFTDAINDLDDCLCLVFLFATFPIDRHTPNDLIEVCRQLYFEFLHYVMASRSLRKCFISIKGYYFMADIHGQKVTWVIPHALCHQPTEDVDSRIMRTFLELYIQMLGFVNFKLYSDSNMTYPPKISYHATMSTKKLASETEFYEEMFASMVIKPEERADADVDEDDPMTEELTEDDEAKKQLQSLNRLKTLFEGCKFFISREVPREVFTFCIRCFGGLVSWPQTSGCGATYSEEDTSITHQLVDRPSLAKVYPNRVYVQPQWVMDCINRRELLPPDQYVPNAELPPHMSPFVTEQHIINDVAEAKTNETDIRLLPSKLDSMTPEERKLREMMIPRKLKRIYVKAVHGRKKKRQQVQQLAEKKKAIQKSGNTSKKQTVDAN